MKIAILVENYFEDVELLYPYYRLKEAGYEVDVVGPKAGEVYKGKREAPSSPRQPLQISTWTSTPGSSSQEAGPPTTCGPAPAS